MAAIGQQILAHGRLTVKLDGPPQQRLQRGPGHAPRDSVDVLTPGRQLLFACRCQLGTTSNFVVYMSEADNVYDPLYGSFADEGAWSTAKMYGVAKLRFGARQAGPAQPDGRNGGRLSWTQPWRPATRRRHGVKHEFLDGGDDVTLATWARCCWNPRLPC